MRKCCILLVTFVHILLPILTLGVDSVDAAPQKSLPLQDDHDKWTLNPYLEVLRDPDESTSITDLNQPPIAESFRPYVSETPPSFGYTNDVYWLRFSVDNQTSQGHWILEISNPPLGVIDCFVLRGEETLYVSRTGSSEPFNSRDLPHRNFAFEIPLPSYEEATVYLRVASESTLAVPAVLWEEAAFAEKSTKEYLILGLYFGIIIAMGLYNAFRYYFVRDKAHLHYAAYIGFVALFHLIWNGLAYQLLWPEQPGWNSHSLNVFLFLTFAALLLFVSSFLEVKHHFPRIDLLLRIFSGVCATMAGISVFLGFTLANQLAIGTIFILIVFLLPLVVSISLKGSITAKYLLVAWFPLSFWASISGLRSLALVPDSLFTLHGPQIASGLEVIIISMGLAHQFGILHKSARTDTLTDIYNRQHLFALGEKEFQHAKYLGDTLSVLILDIDHFKEINDHYGHLIGDQVLIKVVQRCRSILREPDIMGRYGGEEFVVILPGAEHTYGMEIAKRIREHIAASPLHIKNVVPLKVTVSIGVSSLEEKHQSFEELFREADEALYSAKSAGRNIVHSANTVE